MFFYAKLAVSPTTPIVMTLTELYKNNFVEMMKDVSTSIPGHILSFDPVTQLAQVQIGIVRIDVRGTVFTPPPLIEVPVYFAGGKWIVEYQIDPNDEGVILFSQRCIDGWLTTGGVAQNPIMRFHDINDAVFLPGIRSLNNVITGFANDGIRMRNESGEHYVWLKNDGTIELKNSGGIMTIDADGNLSGEFKTFNINSPTFTHNGVNVGETHTHIGNLGSPTSPPTE